MILMNPGGGGGNFDHLIGVVPAGFLHWKVPNNYFVGWCFETK